jgi:hypothetical protein
MNIRPHIETAGLTEFLRSQDRIRVLIDDSGNFGNQAANYNLIRRICQMGFQGIFEVIYFADAKDKLQQLFNLAPNAESHFYSDEHAVEFMTVNEFTKRSQDGIIDRSALGVTGAMDRTPSNWAEHKSNKDFADFLNVDIFVRFSPYYNIDNECNTEIYQRNKSKVIVKKSSCSQMLITPIATLLEAKEYLQKNTVESPSIRNAALLQLISHIEDHSINFQPIYGWTLRESPSNLLNIILGARHAQLTSKNGLHKPLVIGAFFDLDRPNIYQEMVNHVKISNLDILYLLIFFDDWGKYNNYVGAEYLKATIKKLTLVESLRIGYIDSTFTEDQLASLESYQILLLSIPNLPKVVFDGLFTHHAKNIFPPVREGASTLTSLLSVTGRPHMHCRSEMDWEINFNHATPELQYTLKVFNQLLCSAKFPFELDFRLWEQKYFNNPISTFILAANDPMTELSQFFSRLKQDALLPSNDRIAIDLADAVTLVKPRNETATDECPEAKSEPTSILSRTYNTISNVYSGFFSFIRGITDTRLPQPQYQQEQPPLGMSTSTLIFQRLIDAPRRKTYLEIAIDQTISYAADVTINCPSYFPPTVPNYWQGVDRNNVLNATVTNTNATVVFTLPISCVTTRSLR